MRKYGCHAGKKREKDNYTQTVINKMTEIVEKKLENSKALFPIVFTIITSLLVYFFTTDFLEYTLWTRYMIIVYLLLAFCSILIAWYPKNFYQEYDSILGNDSKLRSWFKKCLKKSKLIQEFSPWNIKSYLKLTNQEFLYELEQFCEVKFTKLELLQANILKQKINELYHKKRHLALCCGIIIGGAFVIAMMLFIPFFMNMLKL